MWKNLETFFKADATLEMDSSGKLSSEEMLVAVLAILIRAVHADGALNDFELDRAVEVAAQEFQLDEGNVRQSVEVAQFLSKDSQKLSTLTDNLKGYLNEAQKVEVLRSVWKVIKADSKIEKREAQYAAELRKLLDLTLEQAGFAAAK